MPAAASRGPLRRRLLTGGVLALLTAGVALSSKASASYRVEEPSYEVESTHQSFEVRRYASRIVAQTVVRGSSRDASTRGFRILADYIFGNNRSRESIAMTAPVEMERPAEGTSIQMTAPVESKPSRGDDSWTVTFTMPAEWTMDTLPTPNDKRVLIRELPPARYAVHRFSGSPPQSRVESRKDDLLEAVRAAGLKPAGSAPSYARYDPPWTPWFLRRNEIWIELEPAAG